MCPPGRCSGANWGINGAAAHFLKGTRRIPRKAGQMYGFRTKYVAAAVMALGLAVATVPAQASGVGGADTDLQNSNGDTVNGGTQVTGTTVIDSDSTIGVNKVINGVNVGYGLGGNQVLGSINNATNATANFNQDRHAYALQLENMVLGAVGE